MNVEDKIKQIASRLEEATVEFGQGVENANEEASWMVLQAIGDKALYEPDWQAVLSNEQLSTIDDWLQERIEKRRPFAYIVNKTWFAGYPFYIDERALIPRSFLGEWIDEQFTPWVKPHSVRHILDLCCGSGCIGIACGYAWPDAQVTLSDFDENALAVAQINRENHNMNHRVRLNHGDLFAGLDSRFDLIVCNPPYVSKARMDNLPDEFLHEPQQALASGDDGLDFTRRLLIAAPNYLNDDGVMVVEVGSASHALEAAFANVPFNWLATHYDEMTVFIISRDELLQYADEFKK